MDWVDGQLTRGLSDEEAAWIKEMETQEPAAEKIQQEHQSLIDNIRQAHLHEKVMQLRTLEKSVSKGKPSFGDTFATYIRKPWAIAAVLLAFALHFTMTKQSHRPIECIITTSGLHSCF